VGTGHRTANATAKNRTMNQATPRVSGSTRSSRSPDAMAVAADYGRPDDHDEHVTGQVVFVDFG
jgi:hypothetical protein